MPEIYFPSRNLSVEELFDSNDQQAIDSFLRDNMRSGACSTLTMNSPYCLGLTGPEDKAILATLGNMPRQNRDQLMCVVDEFGDFTTTLAAFYDRHLADLDLSTERTILSAGATASDTRLTGFQRALVEYQSALDALHRHRGVGRGASARRMDLRGAVKQKYEALQQKYQTELKKLARHGGKNRGSAINSAERGIRLAERRTSRHLYVSNAAEARQLGRMASHIRRAGNGLLILDAGLRSKAVYGTYQSGGDWARHASIEATGFGAGGVAGLITGNAVITGLTFIGLGVTPVGWIILIGAGIAAGATAAYYADEKGKEFAAGVWDRR